MPRWIHRTTKQILRSVPANRLPDPPVSNYIEEPDLSAVQGQPNKYWQIVGDTVTLADQATRDAIDAAELTASRDARIVDELQQQENVLRAFMLLVLDEFNLLRTPAYGGLYQDSVQPVQTISHNTVSSLDALQGASVMSNTNMTVNTGTGKIILPTAGDYMVAWQLSFAGTASTTYRISMYAGASTEVDGTRAYRKLGAGGDVGSVSGGAMVTSPQADVPVDLRVVHGEGADRDLTVHAVQVYAYAMPSSMQRTEEQLRTAIRNKLGM